ncbi:hypothetical protein GCM10009665_33400 [Kitasatospora nipponensis]|uniref:Uncharacterized protein n=1 Tax=Kitasatospora nipponensis TaxID=258049 RepID=A0ABN1WEQ1_9ACTN
MATDEDLRAARRLVTQVREIGRDSGREPLRAALRWLTRGRLGRRRGFYAAPELGTPWQDTPSSERPTWRCRGAYLHGEPVFEVDYRICADCRLAWVEQPDTREQYQRLGLATAGLAQLRAEHPGLSWHTLGGHMFSARPFWNTVGTEVAGAYRQRALCPHLELRVPAPRHRRGPV